MSAAIETVRAFSPRTAGMVRKKDLPSLVMVQSVTGELLCYLDRAWRSMLVGHLGEDGELFVDGELVRCGEDFVEYLRLDVMLGEDGYEAGAGRKPREAGVALLCKAVWLCRSRKDAIVFAVRTPRLRPCGRRR